MVGDRRQNRVKQSPFVDGWHSTRVEEEHGVGEGTGSHQRRDVVTANPDMGFVRIDEGCAPRVHEAVDYHPFVRYASGFYGTGTVTLLSASGPG